uniref:Uncharacterized protein n=1 Tax=Strix occidentalis caurina TaxID=311401 RepID=A0A8D0F2V5_STROC
MTCYKIHNTQDTKYTTTQTQAGTALPSTWYSGAEKNSLPLWAQRALLPDSSLPHTNTKSPPCNSQPCHILPDPSQPWTLNLAFTGPGARAIFQNNHMG